MSGKSIKAARFCLRCEGQGRGQVRGTRRLFGGNKSHWFCDNCATILQAKLNEERGRKAFREEVGRRSVEKQLKQIACVTDEQMKTLSEKERNLVQAARQLTQPTDAPDKPAAS